MVFFTGATIPPIVHCKQLHSGRESHVFIGQVSVSELTEGMMNETRFTPKSDQFQMSPAASPEILHHTV